MLHRMKHQRKRCHPAIHTGLTLVEVMISLAIFAGSMAVIGNLAYRSRNNAIESKNSVQAELLAESILAKVQLGIIEMQPAVDEPVAENRSVLGDTIADTNAVTDSGEPLWVYTLEVTDIDEYGLVEIAVTVRQSTELSRQQATCRLVRWLALEPEEEELEESETNTSEGS